jgi:hypothetical protein
MKLLINKVPLHLFTELSNLVDYNGDGILSICYQRNMVFLTPDNFICYLFVTSVVPVDDPLLCLEAESFMESLRIM